LSDIIRELARVAGAYEQPTLTLLHQKHAPIILAIFRSSFSRDTHTIDAPRLHDQVTSYLDELRAAGVPDLPTATGRDLCLRWMHGQWITREPHEDGGETYTLTSHAQDALALVRSLTRDRASLSEHRVNTIVTSVSRFNSAVNPDRQARLDILERDIERLTAERDRLNAIGDLEPVTDDYMLQGYNEIIELVAGLPSDFARVEEAFLNLRSDILAAFRAENQSAGEVLDSYLSQSDDLMTKTAEGRAFSGAFALLRDDALLLQLREDLAALVDHPQASTILGSAERRDLKATVTLIHDGIKRVLAQRARVSASLRDYIVTHDSSSDRELDATLRSIDAELTTWMTNTGPRTVVPLDLLPSRPEIGHLRGRFYDPATDQHPPPLAAAAEQAPTQMSLADLQRHGGPSLETLRAKLAHDLETGKSASLGEFFTKLDPDLRRTVEILGLVHVATGMAEFDRGDGEELYLSVRPDGTERTFLVPRIEPTDHTRQETT
jgi:hypothetical protein